MAIKSGDYYKAKVEEYTAVANAIKVLMGQPQFGSDNYTDKYAYEWTTDYIAKLTQLKTILDRLNDIIGDDDSAEHRYFTIEDDEWVEIYPTPEELEEATTEPIDVDPVEDEVPTEEYTEGTIYVLDSGPVAEIESKIEDIQDEINDILDPNHEEEDKTINEGIEDIKDLIDRIDDIVDGDPTQSTGDSLSELIENIEENKDILEDLINPDYPYYFVVEDGEWKQIYPTPEELEEATVEDITINPIEENTPTEGYSDDVIYKLDRPSQSLDDVVEDIADIIDLKNEFEDLIKRIKEIIHEIAVYTDEEDPITYYYVVVDGEWEVIKEEEINPSIYTEEGEIDFQPTEGDPADAEYNEYTVYAFTESRKSADQYFDDKAEEIYMLMDEEELDWEDLTDDQRLIITIDDLLDYIEELEAEVNEYRNGGFDLIEVSSVVSGSGIFDTIQALEDARRLRMTAEEKEREKTVVYVSRCLFNTTESFACTGLIDGIRKNGAFFYRDSATNNFYNTSAPTSNAKLAAGKYLIRVILYQMVYYYAYDEDLEVFVWKTMPKHEVPVGGIIRTVEGLPETSSANTYYIMQT